MTLIKQFLRTPLVSSRWAVSCGICSFILVISSSFASSSGSPTPALTLTKALELSRHQSLEVQEVKTRLDAQKAREASIDGAYDPVLFSKYQLTNDKSEQNSQFAGEERKIRKTDVGIRALFSTGTQAELTFSYEKFETKFPPGPSSPTVITNPSHTSQVQLMLKQPVWRNFLAREIKLQKRIQSAYTYSASLQVGLQEQLSQAEAEQLYLNVAALQSQLDITKNLVTKTKKFASLMKKRQEIGRADDIDVIAADSRVVQIDSQLLNLEISTEDTKQKLASLLNIELEQVHFSPTKALKASSLPTPTLQQSEAVELAKTQRIDLKIAASQMKPFKLQEKLAKESYKPSINLFASLGSNGIDTKFSDSASESFDLSHKTTVLGVELEWTPYNRKSSYEQFAAKAQHKAAAQKLQVSIRDLKRDIRLAIHKRTSADKQEAQAIKQMTFFDNKIAAEKRRFKQARTERISIVSHEIEKLNAQMNLVAANLNARQAEAMLRLAMHAYPRE